jgi:hypothetical protein
MGVHRGMVAVTRRATQWHVRSLEGSRRNAMLASTQLTERRRERDEVEEYLARHQRQYDARRGVVARRDASGRAAG